MIKVKACTNCGAAFNCGATEAENGCWCNALPNIVPIPEAGDCLCAVCLKQRIAELGRKGKDSNQHGT